MNRLLQVLTLAALAVLFTLPSLAQNGAGPNDIHRTHDYARHIGSASAKELSTGWTSGHGARTHQTHDYTRHTRSGRTTHVHGYYHRAATHHYVSHHYTSHTYHRHY